MDGNSPLCKCLIQGTHQPADSLPCDWIPAVHAGMTGFNYLCITTREELGNQPKQSKRFIDPQGPQAHRWHVHSNCTPNLPGWAVRLMALPARRIVKGMAGVLIWLVNSISRALRVIFSPA